MRPSKIGRCHICGKYGNLSFEHIPPEAAFNNRKVKAYTFEQVIDGERKYRQIQQGYGEYSLCEKCNNDTGGFYGDSYVDFVYQALEIYRITNGDIKDGENLPFDIYPLRVLKQIITMFFTVNFDVFRQQYPRLEHFVLNKEDTVFCKGIHVYLYLIQNMFSTRMTPGVVGVYNIETSKAMIFSEFAFPPLGLILTYDDTIIDSRLLDISFFKNYRYNQKALLNLPIPMMDIQSIMPGEFRSLKEITESNSNFASKR